MIQASPAWHLCFRCRRSPISSAPEVRSRADNLQEPALVDVACFGSQVQSSTAHRSCIVPGQVGYARGFVSQAGTESLINLLEGADAAFDWKFGLDARATCATHSLAALPIECQRKKRLG